MPTDPFVPPDPADRPRQQQNLPPGTALPPAPRWQAQRPGDLAASQPSGALFGTPGPNVGYAYTLAERMADRLQLGLHEALDDVIPTIAEIAGKRAALFGRAPVIHDVDVAVKLLGYDGSADPQFVETRQLIVYEAGHSYYRRREIVDTVPEQLLRIRPDDLSEAVAEWRELTRTKLFPEFGRSTA